VKVRKIVMFGSPISVNKLYRPQVLRSQKTGKSYHGRVVTSKGKIWKLQVKDAYFLKYRDQEPLTGPLAIQITYYFPDRRWRDVTNYDKPILDALVGLAYKDDSQIVTAILHKAVDPASPRTEIRIVKVTMEEHNESMGIIRSVLFFGNIPRM